VGDLSEELAQHEVGWVSVCDYPEWEDLDMFEGIIPRLSCRDSRSSPRTRE
jgi:hypothetical protein